MNTLKKAIDLIKESRLMLAFTGAGISVESGIPPFRGPEGIWNKYDPIVLDLSYFYAKPQKSWKAIKEIFYSFFDEAKPNPAHHKLAWLEQQHILHSIITQNIDNLHQKAGSKNVIEFHGHTRTLTCIKCKQQYPSEVVKRSKVPVCQNCGSVLKPDFIFFGEAIPEPAGSRAFDLAARADLILVIGTTGEVMPAGQIPYIVKRNGGNIIEINTEKSAFTHQLDTCFLQGKASDIMIQIASGLSNPLS